MTKRIVPPIHPGEVLVEEFLRPLGITQYRLATSERFWMNLQAKYDLEVQREQLGDRLDREVKVLAQVP